MPLTQVFVSISDPRSARQVRHDLSELLTVAVCAVLCSADEFSDIEAWAKERIEWLRGFLVLEHGVPSHDTFGRAGAELAHRPGRTHAREAERASGRGDGQGDDWHGSPSIGRHRANWVVLQRLTMNDLR